MIKNLSVISTSRADYGILRPLLQKLVKSFEVELLVSGSHLSTDQGQTVQEIDKDQLGKKISLPIGFLGENNSLGISQFMAETLKVFGQQFAQSKPDLLIALGDRYEMFAAVSASIPFNIPIVHIGGGATTLGAFDNTLRHCLTKMSHLHFVETEHHKNKLLSMGEDASRIKVVGSLSLDNLQDLKLPDAASVLTELGLSSDGAPILVTYHPETITQMSAQAQIQELLNALSKFVDKDIVITGPNMDTDSKVVKQNILNWVEKHPRARFVQSLGTARYFALMKRSVCMVGNSSSGLTEAASFHLPVVNVGQRQLGRLAPDNVIHCDGHEADIVKAMNLALSDKFKKEIKDLKNPYGDGCASGKILHEIKNLKITSQWIMKE